MATEYGLRLKAARTHAGLTQEQLSKLTGIAQSTISTAERKGTKSLETVVYAEACKVNPHWLATGEGSMLGKHYTLTGEMPVKAEAGPATPAAMEIALLYDLIPVQDRVRRVHAYNAATKAILDILESKPAT